MSTARSRRKKTLLLLSLILLALVLFIGNSIWSDRAKRSGEVSINASSISIAQASKPDLVFERLGTEWRMLEPEQLSVLTDRIAPLIKLKSIPRDAYKADEVDLETALLITPLATITIDDSTVLLGDKDVNKERRYAMQDNRVYFVPEWILSLVQGGTQAFADSATQP